MKRPAKRGWRPAQVAVTSNLGDMAAAVRVLGARTTDRVARRSMNRAVGRDGRNAVRSAVTLQTSLKRRFVNNAISYKPAANSGPISAVITARAKPVGLHHLATNIPSNPGGSKRRSVRVKAWGERQTYGWRGNKAPKAFYARVGATVGIFVRTSNKRGPIKMLYGPHLPNEMVRPGSPSIRAFENRVKVVFPRVFRSNFAWEFNKLKGAYGL